MRLRGHFEQIRREQAKQHTAIQMIEEGFSLDRVAKLTSLNQDMIIELKQQILGAKLIKSRPHT